MRLGHPQGAEGQTLTIDGLTLEATPGRRLERVRLAATARSSREQPLVLRIPVEAEVQQVTIDGQDRPARPEKGELRVTVPAGAHTLEVRWQQSRGMGVFYGAPRVALSSPAVNVTQQVTIPPDRWLLATRGPAWGPAVLFWPYLVFLLAVALGLGRLPASPFTSAQWVLLGLGLSVLPALAALVVAAFVFALALRGPKAAPATAWAFDGLQLLLVAWGLVSLGLLYVAIHQGLLFRPDMQVAGNGSTRHRPPLVRRPRDRRDAAGRRPEPAPLGLPRRDAPLGPVARRRLSSAPSARRGAPSPRAASGGRSCAGVRPSPVPPARPRREAAQRGRRASEAMRPCPGLLESASPCERSSPRVRGGPRPPARSERRGAAPGRSGPAHHGPGRGPRPGGERHRRAAPEAALQDARWRSRSWTAPPPARTSSRHRRRGAGGGAGTRATPGSTSASSPRRPTSSPRSSTSRRRTSSATTSPAARPSACSTTSRSWKSAR